MRYWIALAIVCITVSCTQKIEKPKEWAYQKTIKFEGVNPIGIVYKGEELWLSDGDHNRLVRIDTVGNVLESIDSLERPMHIDAHKGVLLVPQYGNDTIEAIEGNVRYELTVDHDFDAPAGVSAHKETMAIADFYNNRIVVFEDGDKLISFGKEGKGQGEFYYPTDVQLTDSLIWVADAYNHRVQVFDREGKFVRMMGQDQKMNAATGVFVSDNEVFVTDFENNRVLVFDVEGNLKQELKKGISKATDLLVKDGLLHIINYRAGELVMYGLKEKIQS